MKKIKIEKSRKENFRLKIAIVGSLWLNTPPKNYGGTESIIYSLVNGLVDKGHDVTFFGPATAEVKAKIIPTAPAPLREMDIGWRNMTYTLYHLSEAFDRAHDFDILHVHLNKAQDYISLPFSVYKNVPTLFTLHFRIPDENYKADRYRILAKYKSLPFASISKSQQKRNLNFVTNVYNGIDFSRYPFNPRPQDYFVWLGKITSFKGTKEAILAARKKGVVLYVLGVIERGVEENIHYFNEEIAPLIDNKQIIFREAVGMPEKAELLGNAKALLNPIQWEEPFGLVMIESQATGTPVIAFNKGSAPEVIQDKKTGFLVSTVDEMVEAMGKINTIDRKACREFAETHFPVEKMIEGYEKAYGTVIDNWDEYYKKQTKES